MKGSTWVVDGSKIRPHAALAFTGSSGGGVTSVAGTLTGPSGPSKVTVKLIGPSGAVEMAVGQSTKSGNSDSGAKASPDGTVADSCGARKTESVAVVPFLPVGRAVQTRSWERVIGSIRERSAVVGPFFEIHLIGKGGL